MKKQIVLALCLLAVTVLLANPSFAQSSGAGQAGSNFLNTLKGLITGNLGLFLGLAITVFGIWTWVINQNTGAGITMIIGGVLLTVAPGLFSGVQSFVNGAMQTFSPNSDGTTINAPNGGRV